MSRGFKHFLQRDGRPTATAGKVRAGGAKQVPRHRTLEQEESPRLFPGWVGSLVHRQMVEWFLEVGDKLSAPQNTSSICSFMPEIPSLRGSL